MKKSIGYVIGLVVVIGFALWNVRIINNFGQALGAKLNAPPAGCTLAVFPQATDHPDASTTRSALFLVCQAK